LLVFFVASLVLYVIYATWRRGQAQSLVPLPWTFLVSTGCLLAISLLVHLAATTVRRDRYLWTCVLLQISVVAALVFVWIQFDAMSEMLAGPAFGRGFGKGVVGMVVVLAWLHALHVVAGIIAMGIVSVRAMAGRYDHERHWPVDFTAQYWHFLDIVWLCMLAAFWMTTGGFGH
jgi:cytochrome c oxidase subunit 3